MTKQQILERILIGVQDSRDELIELIRVMELHQQALEEMDVHILHAHEALVRVGRVQNQLSQAYRALKSQ